MAFSRLSWAAVLAAAGFLSATPTHAVFILHTVWEENGGSPEDWGEGFGPAKDLAAEGQFASVIGFQGQFSEDRHFGCSGTWLGNNEAGNAIILTAAHCMVDIDLNDWTYITTFGSEFAGLNAYIHPFYDNSEDMTNGYDLAIVELDGPIEDVEEPAVLYAGNDELGYYAVTVGYGLRGPGNYSDDRKFNTDHEKAAATNMIDLVTDAENDGWGGNELSSDFDSPDGDTNTLEGDAYPVDELEGIMGQGDSGGSGWIETDEGWRVIGVNASSDVRYGYGKIASHARISTQLPWVLSIFPEAQYGK